MRSRMTGVAISHPRRCQGTGEFPGGGEIVLYLVADFAYKNHPQKSPLMASPHLIDLGAKQHLLRQSGCNSYAPSPASRHHPRVSHPLTSWLTYLSSVSLHSHMSSISSLSLLTSVSPTLRTVQYLLTEWLKRWVKHVPSNGLLSD